jgi:hypothetical protein
MRAAPPTAGRLVSGLATPDARDTLISLNIIDLIFLYLDLID